MKKLQESHAIGSCSDISVMLLAASKSCFQHFLGLPLTLHTLACNSVFFSHVCTHSVFMFVSSPLCSNVFILLSLSHISVFFCLKYPAGYLWFLLCKKFDCVLEFVSKRFMVQVIFSHFNLFEIIKNIG
jgi:hypothetical protein